MMEELSVAEDEDLPPLEGESEFNWPVMQPQPHVLLSPRESTMVTCTCTGGGGTFDCCHQKDDANFGAIGLNIYFLPILCHVATTVRVLIVLI